MYLCKYKLCTTDVNMFYICDFLHFMFYFNCGKAGNSCYSIKILLSSLHTSKNLEINIYITEKITCFVVWLWKMACCTRGRTLDKNTWEQGHEIKFGPWRDSNEEWRRHYSDKFIVCVVHLIYSEWKHQENNDRQEIQPERKKLGVLIKF